MANQRKEYQEYLDEYKTPAERQLEDEQEQREKERIKHNQLVDQNQMIAIVLRNMVGLATEAITDLYMNPNYGPLFIADLIEAGGDPEDLAYRRERCDAAAAKRAPNAGGKRARVEASIMEALNASL